MINESLICSVYIIILISFDTNQSKNFLIYTNLCINFITATWAMNVAYSLIITFIKIYDKIRGCIAGRTKVGIVTKVTEIKDDNIKGI